MSSLKIESLIAKNRKKRIVAFTILFTLLLVFFILSLIFGSTFIPINELCSGFFDSTSTNYIILYKIRLPRAIAAIIAGMGLSLAGVILQSLMHNDLVSPNTIGISSGAGFIVVLIVSLFSSLSYVLPIFAFIGAFLTSILIYFIALACGGKKYTIILVGIAVSALFQALMKLIFVFYPDSLVASNDFLIGTLANVKMADIIPSIIIIVIGTIVTFILSDKLNIMALGDKEASSLGLNVNIYRFIFMALASILASAVISYAGLIGFVGLMVPHISKRIVGNNHKVLIPFASIFGGLLVLVCDLLTKLIFSPYEVPCGILIAILGVVFFIYLLLRRKKNVSL